MTALLLLGYYLFAFATIFGVAYFTHRQNMRALRRQMDEIDAQVQEAAKKFPPLPPYVPEPIPDDEPDADDEYADAIASVRNQLADLADHGYPVAAALKEVDALARQIGV
jgi:hypothetical protein